MSSYYVGHFASHPFNNLKFYWKIQKVQNIFEKSVPAKIGMGDGFALLSNDRIDSMVIN